MTATTMDVSDLVRQIEELGARRAASKTCQITLINNCPPAWGVVIESAGVKFFYRDGSDYTDGPRNINLHSGQSATFISNDGTKCVFQFFMALIVYVPGEGSKTLTYQNGVGAGECLFHMSVTLGPKESAAQTALATVKLTDLLSVVKS